MGKECDVCHRPFRGFGPTCPDCRKRSSAAGATAGAGIVCSPADIKRTSLTGGNKCFMCNLTAYDFGNDGKIGVDGVIFHKTCFKCAECSRKLDLGAFAKGADGAYYCKPHFAEKFKLKGRYDFKAPTPGVSDTPRYSFQATPPGGTESAVSPPPFSLDTAGGGGKSPGRKSLRETGLLNDRGELTPSPMAKKDSPTNSHSFGLPLRSVSGESNPKNEAEAGVVSPVAAGPMEVENDDRPDESLGVNDTQGPPPAGEL